MQSVTTTAAVLLTCTSLSLAARAQTPGQDQTTRDQTSQAQTGQNRPDQAPPSSPAGAQASPQSPGTDLFGDWMKQSGAFWQQGGQLMQQGVADMGAGFGQMVGAIGGQANQATKEAADAARSAATSVSKLPNTGIINGNEHCAIAPNGAPDCGDAAAKLCRTKGYAGGNSVDFVTVENCPPPYRTSRRDAPEGVCTMEHYVTKALCQ